jgi:hypothetical protein
MFLAVCSIIGAILVGLLIWGICVIHKEDKALRKEMDKNRRWI